MNEILAQVREDLLLELNSRIATSEAPTKLFKEQQDTVAILRGNLKHPTVPREDSLELLQLLRQPMPRTLRRELKGVLATHANGDYGALVSELHGFVTRYDLSTNGQEESQNPTDEEVREEDLELIAYLDLS